MSSPFPPNPPPAGGQPPNPFGSPGPSGASNPTPPNPFASSQPSFGQPPSYGQSPADFSPSGPASTYEPYPGPASRLSLLAVASMIFGTGGFLTCCCAIFGIPSSLLAIATGHTALIFINRSDSKLTGKVPAAIGLVGGYLGLLISVGFLLVGAFSPDKKEGPVAEAPRHTTADDLLNVAENKIRTDSGGIAHGNTDE